MILQARMNKEFDDYLAVSEELKADTGMFLELKEQDIKWGLDIRWRRNFVRTWVSVIEGYNYSIRKISAAQIAYLEYKCVAPTLYKKERQVFNPKLKFSIYERIKYTLRGSHRLFELYPLPEFGTKDWEYAREGLIWRNQIIHPKSPKDLQVSQESWEQIYHGLVWLFEQNCEFFRMLYEKYGQQRN